MPTMRSFAKINLFLEVARKRPDNYHDIDSVFLEIGLADTLSAEAAPKNQLTLACDRPDVPTGPDNLVLKAAELLRRECGTNAGATFNLTKHIPMGGGLGGGSSNAATALRLLNSLWKLGLNDKELAELGARIGSDIPFFLTGGTCLCQGRGEIVTPLPPFPKDILLGLALPPVHSNTTAAYKELKLPNPGEQRKPDGFIAAMRTGDAKAMQAEAFNRFETTVFTALPELGRIHDDLEKQLDRPVRLSGSGAGMWFFGEAQPCSEGGTFCLTTRSRDG